MIQLKHIFILMGIVLVLFGGLFFLLKSKESYPNPKTNNEDIGVVESGYEKISAYIDKLDKTMIWDISSRNKVESLIERAKKVLDQINADVNENIYSESDGKLLTNKFYTTFSREVNSGIEVFFNNANSSQKSSLGPIYNEAVALEIKHGQTISNLNAAYGYYRIVGTQRGINTKLRESGNNLTIRQANSFFSTMEKDVNSVPLLRKSNIYDKESENAKKAIAKQLINSHQTKMLNFVTNKEFSKDSINFFLTQIREMRNAPFSNFSNITKFTYSIEDKLKSFEECDIAYRDKMAGDSLGMKVLCKNRSCVEFLFYKDLCN